MTSEKVRVVWSDAATLTVMADACEERGDEYAASIWRALFAARHLDRSLRLGARSRELLNELVSEGGRAIPVAINNANTGFLTDHKALWRSTREEKESWLARGLVTPQEYRQQWLDGTWPEEAREELVVRGATHRKDKRTVVISLGEGTQITPRYLAWAIQKWPMLRLHAPKKKNNPIIVLQNEERVARICTLYPE